mgnify:CR=1 FL=1
MKFLAQRQKRTKQYFNSLVNVDNNLFVNPRSNTSTSVNAKITRLFSQLSNVCEQNNISVQSNSVSSNSFLSSESDSTEKEFGFGLLDYQVQEKLQSLIKFINESKKNMEKLFISMVTK